MRLRSLFHQAGLLVILGVCSQSCGSDAAQEPGWDYSFVDIAGETRQQSPNVAVDLYIDATVSMAGFVGTANPVLARLVQDLEAAVGTGWTSVSVRYFQFGAKVVEGERATFIRRVREPGFFREKGIAERTNIDAVLAQSDPRRLTLVITDLFQHDGDVNAVVTALKDNLIAKGVAVGILPVLSEFAGTVYDARVPPYAYASFVNDPNSYRAFYLLMFGDRVDMQRMVDVMGNKPYVDQKLFLLLSKHPVKSQVATAPRETLSKNLVAVKTSGEPKPNEIRLDLRDQNPASLTVQVDLEPDPASPRLRSDRLEMSVVKRLLSGDASPTETETPSTDLSLSAPFVVASATRVQIPLKLELRDPPGLYAYRVDLRTPTLNAFETPAWVSRLTTDNPSASFEPNKTLNLAPFTSGLIQASTSVHQLAVARFFLTVRKR